MLAVTTLLQSLAVLALLLSGLLAILGIRGARDTLLRAAFTAFGLALLVRCVLGAATSGWSSESSTGRTNGAALPTGVVALMIIGHVVLGVALLRRRFGGTDRLRDEAQEIERARTRERSRLPPEV